MNVCCPTQGNWPDLGQLPTPCSHSPPPHVVYIDRCISKTIVWASYRCESWGFFFCISSHQRCSTPRLLVNSVCSATVSSENTSLFACYSLPEQTLWRTLTALFPEYFFVFFFSFLFSPRRSKRAVGKKVDLVNFRIIKYLCQVSGQLNLLPVAKAFFSGSYKSRYSATQFQTYRFPLETPCYQKS